MSTLSISATSSYISSSLAQQRVQGDQAQVRTDRAQLTQDQAQLNKDVERSAAEQQQAQGIQQNQGKQAVQAGLDKINQSAQQTLPSQSVSQTSSSAIQDSTGQQVGSIISIVA